MRRLLIVFGVVVAVVLFAVAWLPRRAEDPSPADLPAIRDADALEVRLPAVGPYVAIELAAGI